MRFYVFKSSGIWYIYSTDKSDFMHINGMFGGVDGVYKTNSERNAIRMLRKFYKVKCTNEGLAGYHRYFVSVE